MRARVSGPRLTVYRPATAAGFSPSDITGLQAWYDASDAATITASGGKATQWNDKTANARNVTQGTSTNQPTTGSRTLNSLNALGWLDDGSDDLMTSSAWSLSQPLTVVGVIKYDRTTGAQQEWVSTDGGAACYLPGDSSARLSLYAGSILQSGAGVADTNPHLLICVFNGGSSAIYLDSSSTTVASGNAGAGGITKTAIGAAAGPANGYDGALGEVLYYDSALGSTDRASLLTYSQSKWGTP